MDNIVLGDELQLVVKVDKWLLTFLFMSAG